MTSAHQVRGVATARTRQFRCHGINGIARVKTNTRTTYVYWSSLQLCDLWRKHARNSHHSNTATKKHEQEPHHSSMRNLVFADNTKNTLYVYLKYTKITNALETLTRSTFAHARKTFTYASNSLVKVRSAILTKMVQTPSRQWNTDFVIDCVCANVPLANV